MNSQNHKERHELAGLPADLPPASNANLNHDIRHAPVLPQREHPSRPFADVAVVACMPTLDRYNVAYASMLQPFQRALKRAFPKAGKAEVYTRADDVWRIASSKRADLVVVFQVIWEPHQCSPGLETFEQVKLTSDAVSDFAGAGRPLLVCDYSDYATDLEGLAGIDPRTVLYLKEQTWHWSMHERECVLPVPILPPDTNAPELGVSSEELDNHVIFVGQADRNNEWRDIGRLHEVCQRAGWHFDYHESHPNYERALCNAAVALAPRGVGPVTWRLFEILRGGGLPLAQEPDTWQPDVVPSGGLYWPSYRNYTELYERLVALRDPMLRDQWRRRGSAWYQQCYGRDVVEDYIYRKIMNWWDLYRVTL